MHEVLQSPMNVWLIAGAFIVAFEAFTTPGLGLFLGGLGALCTAVLIKAGVIDEAAIAAQFAWCFGLTAVWTIVLWKPLQTFRMRRRTRDNKIENNNLIGQIAIVGSDGLQPGKMGQVVWSGTVMNAELELPNVEALAEGTKVRIRSVYGNILKVTI